MIYRYEYNVTQEGVHVFKITPPAFIRVEEATKLWKELTERFPVSEDFAVTLTQVSVEVYRELETNRPADAY